MVVAVEKNIEVANVISELEVAVKKAAYCQQEVCEDFFGRGLNEDTILAEEFERFGTFAHITQDNIIKIEQALEQLKILLK